MPTASSRSGPGGKGMHARKISFDGGANGDLQVLRELWYPKQRAWYAFFVLLGRSKRFFSSNTKASNGLSLPHAWQCRSSAATTHALQRYFSSVNRPCFISVCADSGYAETGFGALQVVHVNSIPPSRHLSQWYAFARVPFLIDSPRSPPLLRLQANRAAHTT